MKWLKWGALAVVVWLVWRHLQATSNSGSPGAATAYGMQPPSANEIGAHPEARRGAGHF